MKRLLITVIGFVFACTQGMYEYKQAQLEDVPQLLDIISNEAIHESKKIVILPEKFREMALCGAIKKGRIFVAKDQDKIVSYKKLFLITDEAEKDDILYNEIRALGHTAQCTYAGVIDENDSFVIGSTVKQVSPYTTCIYNGADFTRVAYRGKGINHKLMAAALAVINNQVRESMKKHACNTVTMLYGITEENAGPKPGVVPDRTPSISRSFKEFVRTLENNDNPVTLQHYRYRAFMPTFDPKSDVLQPLPDDKSVPGFGCSLSYTCKEIK